jgi:site-specific recombinase XerC
MCDERARTEIGFAVRCYGAPGADIVPVVIADAGDHAARRFLAFFAATIRNKNIRMAYYRAACHFFSWVERHEIAGLADIEPIHVAAYIEALQDAAAKPTVKQRLAAIRKLFDWLVHRPSVGRQPGARRARAQARRQTRQDAGVDRGRGAEPARQYRHI